MSQLIAIRSQQTTEKDVGKLAKKIATVAKIFLSPKWTEQLRGKERSLKSLSSCVDVAKKCVAEQREHLLPDLDELDAAVEAALSIVKCGKTKQFVATELCKGLDSLVIFYAKYTDTNLDEACKFLLHQSLEKLLVFRVGLRWASRDVRYGNV